MQDRLVPLARYNVWANEKLWEKLAAVPEAAFAEDRKAFFGSLMGTLNHILVGTRTWLDRCEGTDGSWFKALNQVLEPEPGALRQAMAAEDRRLVAFVESRTPDELAGNVEYRNTRGDPFSSPLHWILTHVVNHATHHRGQASDIVSGMGLPTPEMDLIYYLRQQGLA
jgi:uncharacterized damage-inducible protein DinB